LRNAGLEQDEKCYPTFFGTEEVFVTDSVICSSTSYFVYFLILVISKIFCCWLIPEPIGRLKLILEMLLLYFVVLKYLIGKNSKIKSETSLIINQQIKDIILTV